MENLLQVMTLMAQLVTIAMLMLRREALPEPDSGSERSIPKRLILPSGESFTLDTIKRSVTVNDDEALFERELEKKA